MAPLTYNETMLRNVRQAIAEAIASGVQSANLTVGTGGQGYTRLSLEALRKLETQYAALVTSERRHSPLTIVRPDFGNVR